jgi:hypothetical protein
MRHKINYYFFALWPIFIISLATASYAFYLVNDWMVTYGTMGPIPPPIYYTYGFWLLLLAFPSATLTGMWIFKFGYGTKIFIEDPTPEEIKAYQDLMTNKGFTFEQADNYLKKEKQA